MLRSRRNFIFSLATCTLASAHAERVVRITNGEWPPYLSAHLPHFGTASRIASEAFALQGVRVQYDFFPWRRALALARSGDWDGSAVWLKNADRERDFYVSDPVAFAEYVFFYRREMQFDWSSLADLERYRVGITNDYFYGEAFAAAAQSGRLQVDGVPSDAQNFRKLLGGRIDVFPMDRIAGFALLNRQFAPDEVGRLAAHPKPLYRHSMHLLLSRKVPGNAQLMNEFNVGLHKLRASGQLDAYLKEAEKLKPLAAAGK